MDKLIITFTPIETINTCKNVTHLRFLEPTINQIQNGYNELLDYIDDAATDSDPDVTSQDVLLALLRPAFNDLIIYRSQTVDYDYCNLKHHYIKYTEITLAYIIDQAEFEKRYFDMYSEYPDYDELRIIFLT